MTMCPTSRLSPVLTSHTRYSPKVLKRTPVDVLVVKRGHIKHPTQTYERKNWEILVAETLTDSQPKIVIEAWPPSAHSWIKGPICKATLTRWKNQGYDS